MTYRISNDIYTNANLYHCEILRITSEIRLFFAAQLGCSDENVLKCAYNPGIILKNAVPKFKRHMNERESVSLRDHANNSRNSTFFAAQSGATRLKLDMRTRTRTKVKENVQLYRCEMLSVHIRSRIKVLTRLSEELPKSDFFFLSHAEAMNTYSYVRV